MVSTSIFCRSGARINCLRISGKEIWILNRYRKKDIFRKYASTG